MVQTGHPPFIVQYSVVFTTPSARHSLWLRYRTKAPPPDCPVARTLRDDGNRVPQRFHGDGVNPTTSWTDAAYPCGPSVMHDASRLSLLLHSSCIAFPLFFSLLCLPNRITMRRRVVSVATHIMGGWKDVVAKHVYPDVPACMPPLPIDN